MFPKILVILVLACSLSAVFAIRHCYSCNSSTDKNPRACLDPVFLQDINITRCQDNYLCTRVSYTTQKEMIVSRGCHQEGDTCSNIYKNLTDYVSDIMDFNCYSCAPEYCNRAPPGVYHATELEQELDV